MSAEPTPTPIQISDIDLDLLVEHMRRTNRPFRAEELAQHLQEVWRRRREGR